MTAVISEMLFQSYNGKIRLFPAVADEMSARFDSLRTVGAFLVASEIEKSQVNYVKIKSLKGRICTVYWARVLTTQTTSTKIPLVPFSGQLPQNGSEFPEVA